MPDCGCFHRFNLTPAGPKTYRLWVALEGHADLAHQIVAAGLADKTSDPQLDLEYGVSFTLFDVPDAARLWKLCDALKSAVLVDLAPELDYCYALGPYSLFSDDSSPSRSKLGDLVNRGKYWKERNAIDELGQLLLQFIQSHPVLSGVTAISAPPKSQSELPNLAGSWAETIANRLGVDTITANKIRATPPQKNISDDEGEFDIIERIKDSISVSGVALGSRVLILDDTIRSGGTLKEIARALRHSGAESVYGLSAAKDAKFTNGGINLDRSAWI